MRLPRRPRHPEAVRALRLERGEHVTAVAGTADGGHVVATTAGVRRLDASGDGGAVLPWVEVDRATWEPPRLHVEPAPTLDGTPRPAWDVDLVEPGTLPRELRARVDATVVWSVRRALASASRGGVRIVARRPAEGGRIRWRVWPDPGLHLQDPLVRAEIEDLLHHARVAVGDGADDDGQNVSIWS